MHLVVHCGTADTCGWRIVYRIDFLAVVKGMTIACCMHSRMRWVSRNTEDTWIGLDRQEFQTPVDHFAKELRSAFAGRSLNTAYQSSA